MMHGWTRRATFLQALGVTEGDAVCITGAGGKTSLMFRLAAEARKEGWKVLVTTTTRILFPAKGQYDSLAFDDNLPPLADSRGWIHVLGRRCPEGDKICSAGEDLVIRVQADFDLLLIEADGAACKPLKGWKADEPVIPDFTTRTIGVVDIQSIGQIVAEKVIHRMKLFTELTGSAAGEPISLAHLGKIITSKRGLFQHSAGKKVLYLNKMESESDLLNGRLLGRRLEAIPTAAGSIHRGRVYV